MVKVAAKNYFLIYLYEMRDDKQPQLYYIFSVIIILFMY